MRVKTTISPYVGAKAKFAENLVQHFPLEGIKDYYSVFGGMANDILAKPIHGQKEHLNDLDPVIYTLLKVLTDGRKGKELIDRMLRVPYTEETFKIAKNMTADEKKFQEISDEIDKAMYAWTVLLMSKNGARQSFKGMKVGTEEIKLRESLVKKVELLKRLDGIEVTNMDAVDLIKQLKEEGRTDIFVYADSPYYGENCSSKKHYSVDMETETKQDRYLKMIADVPFPMMISGYDSKLYKELLENRYGWNKKLIAVVHKTMRMKRGMKNRVNEYIWTNYKTEKDGKVVLTSSRQQR